MITIGPWLAGRIVLSRRRMTEQLQARNDELQAEQELFARESVRYERARIAREAATGWPRPPTGSFRKPSPTR